MSSSAPIVVIRSLKTSRQAGADPGIPEGGV